jgi:hypothetical protein
MKIAIARRESSDDPWIETELSSYDDALCMLRFIDGCPRHFRHMIVYEDNVQFVSVVTSGTRASVSYTQRCQVPSDPHFLKKFAEQNRHVLIHLVVYHYETLESIAPESIAPEVSKVTLGCGGGKQAFQWLARCYKQLRGKSVQIVCSLLAPPPIWMAQQLPRISMYATMEYDGSQPKLTNRHIRVNGDHEVLECLYLD